MADSAGAHTPVLLREVLAGLNIREGGAYLDATFGRGGHAGAILQNLSVDGRLLCIDRDGAAVGVAISRFAADPRVAVLQAPFSALAKCADAALPGRKLDGILFDLGVSSPQLDDPARGFSFMQDGPLDMRMNLEEGVSAADVVNGASRDELTRVFRDFGEERFAARIARAIVADRESRPFTRTEDLAALIARVVPSRERNKHPATRVFQALRIRVNRELEELAAGLAAALAHLAPRGRLAVISFHSLEDRMVKHFMRTHASVDPRCAGGREIPPRARPRLARGGWWASPSLVVVARNPRARSARLRIAERLEGSP